MHVPVGKCCMHQSCAHLACMHRPHSQMLKLQNELANMMHLLLIGSMASLTCTLRYRHVSKTVVVSHAVRRIHTPVCAQRHGLMKDFLMPDWIECSNITVIAVNASLGYPNVVTMPCCAGLQMMSWCTTLALQILLPMTILGCAVCKSHQLFPLLPFPLPSFFAHPLTKIRPFPVLAIMHCL